MQRRKVAKVRGRNAYRATSRIRISGFGYCDDEKFAQLVQDVWFQIAYAARRSMISYWNRSPFTYPTRCLRIEALDDWSTRDTTHENMTMGQVGVMGSEMRIWAPLISVMPNEHLRALLAHEFAHVVQYSTDERKYWDMSDEWDREVMEADADDKAGDWGFDTYAMRDWIYANGELLEKLNQPYEVVDASTE